MHGFAEASLAHEVDEWDHKYFEWEENGVSVHQPFININCVKKSDQGISIISKHGVNASVHLYGQDIPGQLDAYLRWVDVK